MANERNRPDNVEDLGSRNQDNQSDMTEERLRGGGSDDVRGVADEGEEEFEDTDDLEDEDDSDDGSI